jgi:tripartite-type tricarboxylate transporter receptor subunit TctC
MKKFLAILLVTLTMTVSAKENITIVYSWTASDNAANFYRTLADESNKIQDKYNFIVDYKPGAGGSVAAQHVQTNPGVILANSSALFIRPVFYPEGSHDSSNFKSIMPMCLAPFVIASGKYKSWADVPTDKPLSIGHSGNGTTTHLVAQQIADKYPQMIIVPFKSTSEAFLGAMQGSIDFSVGFMGDADAWTAETKTGKTAYLLGTTGTHQIKTVPLLTTQGFTKDLANMNTPQQLFVSTKFPDDKFKEVRAIFVKAATADSVKKSNALDYCVPNNQLGDAEIQSLFNFQSRFWKSTAERVGKTAVK